jgi:hypothetical protein
MAFKTVGDLREWLQQRGDDKERLIGDKWLVWVSDGGSICVGNPRCANDTVSFCPIADDEEDE